MGDTPLIAVAAATHPGLVRPSNEDAIVVGPWVGVGRVAPPRVEKRLAGIPLMVAVADGLGGHAGGEVASELCARRLAALDGHTLNDDSLISEINAIDRSMYQVADRRPELTGMATTVAGILIDGSSIVVFNVGDSRVYMNRRRFLRQVSIDDAAPIRTDRAVTQSLGGGSRNTEVTPHTSRFRVERGRRFLICSDGLYGFVDIDTMEHLIGEEVGVACSNLLKAALQGGGGDNISVVVVGVGDE